MASRLEGVVGVSSGVNAVRFETAAIGVGAARSRSALGWLMALAAVCLVFACAFAIGRATRTTSAGGSEAQYNVSVSPNAAAVPARLSVAPPVPLALPAPPVVHHARQAPSAVATPAAPSSAEPAPAAVAAPAPTPAPAPSHPSGSPSSGGGSFEISG
jgi:hypothetical protein